MRACLDQVTSGIICCSIPEPEYTPQTQSYWLTCQLPLRWFPGFCISILAMRLAYPRCHVRVATQDQAQRVFLRSPVWSKGDNSLLLSLIMCATQTRSLGLAGR